MTLRPAIPTPIALARATWRRLATLLLVLAVAAATSTRARAQTFTRIVDPANPVITDLFESGGGSWFDLDGDGRLDLFVPHGNLSSQSNSLYLNLGGFAFRRVVTGPLVNDGGSSIGGCWGDFDRDGHADLFVANRNSFGNFLYRGLGDSSFARVIAGGPATDLANSNSASWVDVNSDGNLDLYVVNFQGDDFLYVNAGPPAYALQRVTPAWTTGTEFSIHGAWADFDNDGRMDLFVGNAGTQNDYLFVNQGGLNFVKRVLPDGRSSLGASWSDYDNDGYLDLFVANYGEAAILYHNSGPPNFDLVPVSTAVFPGTVGSAVGSAWGDVDNDGDLDLLVANDNGENEALFINAGPPSYTFTRVATGSFTTSGGNSFGCSLVDIDGDGDLDAFVANRSNQPDMLFRNDGPVGTWLALRLRGVLSNPQAIGARVRVLAGVGGAPRWQMQQVLPLSGYNSQNLELHFGLGGAAVADSIEIVWPSGIHQGLTGVPANQRLEVTEEVATPVEASLVSVDADPGRVTLTWEVAGAAAAGVALERGDAGASWVTVGRSRPDGTGRVRFVDSGVTPGAAYRYRLVVDRAGGPAVLAETAVQVPAAIAALALEALPPPNGSLRVRVRMPAAGEARLEVLDLTGRQRAPGLRARLSAGIHELDLDPDGRLPAGVYFVRLSRDSATRSTSAVVLR